MKTVGFWKIFFILDTATAFPLPLPPSYLEVDRVFERGVVILHQRLCGRKVKRARDTYVIPHCVSTLSWTGPS
jgi:hypothetical protein